MKRKEGIETSSITKNLSWYKKIFLRFGFSVFLRRKNFYGNKLYVRIHEERKMPFVTSEKSARYYKVRQMAAAIIAIATGLTIGILVTM